MLGILSGSTLEIVSIPSPIFGNELLVTLIVTGILPILAFSSIKTRRSNNLDSPGNSIIPELPIFAPLVIEK
ncbi:MAG: Uncharacterised protein [Methanobacteriota archaeon]|nr:MAG: Uncharacterised protein [Euryarchaeota archaeon]